MFSVFHPLPSKIPYPKHPRGSYRKTYSTFKNYDARNATFKHLQLFEISSYLSTKHLKLTSLHLSSSSYQNIFSFFIPFHPKSLIPNTLGEAIEKLIQHSKTTTLEMLLSNIYNFLKYHPIFLQNISN